MGAFPELLKICQETQKALTKQAEAMAGRKTIHPEPTTNEILHECRLELVGIRDGSTRLDFGIAKPQIALPFPEARSFGADMVAELATAIRSLGKGNKKDDIDPGVLQSIYSLTDLLGKRGIGKIDWEVPQEGRKAPLKVALNAKVRERAASRLHGPLYRTVQLDGVLDMADFNPRERKCRIDPAIGSSTVCTFGEKDEDIVHSLLRQPVRVIGEGRIHPYTNRLDGVDIRSISALPSLALGEGDFFASLTIRQLAEKQGVESLHSIGALRGVLSEEEADDFLASILEGRKTY